MKLAKDQAEEIVKLVMYTAKRASFWKEYINRVPKLNSYIDEPTVGSDFFIRIDTNDAVIQICGGDTLIEYNHKNNKWELQIWVPVFNNHNGDADSDYSLVSEHKTVSEAVMAAMYLPARQELDTIAEIFYCESHHLPELED